MSNPGVIILESQSGKKKFFKRFQIEDNIGESIHIHIDSMRFDLTIKEFLELSELIRESIDSLNVFKDYSVDNFDESFILECSSFIDKLVKIEKHKIKLGQLKCLVRSKNDFMRVKKIKESPIYNFLLGKEEKFKEYNQENYKNITNIFRIKNLKNSLDKNGYPHNKNYIILFDNDNIIRDGQHRASILMHKYGEQKEIEVLRFYFNGSKHKLKLLKSNSRVIRKLLKGRIKKCLGLK